MSQITCDFKDVSIFELIDMLAAETVKYTKLITQGSTLAEFARSELFIKALQAEIRERKKQMDETPSPPDFF